MEIGTFCVLSFSYTRDGWLLAWGDYRVEDLTVFGDGDNDVGMFELAPHAVATANATERLRNLATAIIGPNSEDSVVRYLTDLMR